MPNTLAAATAAWLADEPRIFRALGAMLALETLLENQPLGASVPAAEVHALVELVNDAVRDVLVWEPPSAANDD